MKNDRTTIESLKSNCPCGNKKAFKLPWCIQRPKVIRFYIFYQIFTFSFEWGFLGNVSRKRFKNMIQDVLDSLEMIIDFASILNISEKGKAKKVEYILR